MKTLKYALAISLLLPFLSMADVVVPIDEVESFVNIRSAPSGNSEVVGRLQQATNLPHIGTKDGWHEVQLDDGSTGFLSADWANVESEPLQAETAAADVEDAVADSEEIAAEATAAANDVVAENMDSVQESVPDEMVEESPADDVAGAVISAAENIADTIVEDVIPHEEPVEATTAISDGVVEKAAAADSGEEPPEVTDAASEDNAVDEEGATALQPDARIVETAGSTGPPGPPGPVGPAGPPGPAGASAGSDFEGKQNYLVKFAKPTVAGESQIYDNGRSVGIGTTDPKQRLEVNGNIQIHASTSNVAGLMITQSSGDTGYIMHNRAGSLTIGAGSVDRVTIDGAGNVGIGQARPSHPIDMASGAHVSTGGVWTNSSSIANKENIESLTVAEALAALTALEPVLFNYRNNPGESHVGFVAEDVPDLVATSDRKGLSPMDIVAVLTRIVQMQQSRIEELELRLDSRSLILQAQ